MADTYSLWDSLENGINNPLARVLGINPGSYREARGQSTQDWASRWSSGLADLSGYYDTGKASSLYSSLGNTTSATYLSQLTTLAEESNRLYTLINDPEAVRQKLHAEAERNGGIYAANIGSGYRIEQGKWGKGGGGYVYDIMGNRYDDIASSPMMKSLYGWVDAFSHKQGQIVSELTAQQGREQNYISQISGLLQQGTLAKTKAEQAAQQKALEEQYAQQQAELNKQAEENARILKEKQEAQTKMFNESAKITAESNAATSQLQQAKSAATQVASVGASRGGEAVSSTNAAAKSKTRQTTRTERWQSTRSPAAGGGGINV